MFGKEKVVAEGPVVMADVAGQINLEGPIVLDLGQIRDEPVEEGWHTVTIERADAKTSSQKGLPMIFVLSRITDEDDPEHTRTIIWNIMLSGEGLVFTKRCFSALGMPEQLNYASYQALANDLIGHEVEVKVKHRTYEGEQSVQVNNWRQVTLAGFDL